MRKSVWLAMALCFVGIQSVHAQEVKERGSNSISLGAAANTARIGYWHKLSDELSLGGDFTAFYRNHNHNDTQEYQFSPGIKYYVTPQSQVSPYLYGALVARYTNTKTVQSDSSARTESYIAGVQGGVGLEWFPTQRVSIAGHVGAIAQYERNHSTYSFTSANNDEGFSTGTISSGILLNLFF